MQRDLAEYEIGVATQKGLRYWQEDRFDYTHDLMASFSKLPRSAQRAAIFQAFEELQEQHCQHAFVGSTACMAAAWISNTNTVKTLHLVTANLGDSHAHLVIVNSETGAVQRHALLTKIQKPTDPLEAQRITEAGGYVRKDRLNGDLAMSRAFGDIRHDGKGLSHRPEIEFRDMTLALNESAYIIVVSDGLDLLEASEYGEIVGSLNVTRGEPLAQPALIAEELVSRSLAKKSDDNCTAIAFIAQEDPISISVFDGHGGSDVAEKLSKHFYPTLANKATLALSTQSASTSTSIYHAGSAALFVTEFVDVEMSASQIIAQQTGRRHSF